MLNLFSAGDLVQKIQGGEQVSTIKARAWYLEHHPSSCMWTCCGERGHEVGCKSGEHTTAFSDENGEALIARAPTSTSMIIAPASSRTVNGVKGVDGPNTFPGQDFVRRICEAEKEQEKSAKSREQNPTKSPPAPPPLLRSASSAALPTDVNFQALPDYSPPLRTLPKGAPERIFDVSGQWSPPIDLSSDPDRHHLHEAEIALAQKLRLTCASYLCTKRRIFKGLVESLQEGKEYKKSYAQNACRIDVRKTRALFAAFESVGWFDPKHFTKYAPDAKLGTGEMSDSDLSSVDEEAITGAIPNGLQSNTNHERPYSPTAAAHPTPRRYAPSTANGVPLSNGDRPESGNGNGNGTSKRKQPHPVHNLHPSTSFKPVNDVPPAPISPHSTASLAVAPPATYPPDPYPQKDDYDGTRHQQTRAQGPPPASDSPETYQWRKTGSGKKVQVPICPYPRTWGEADSVDRELVRLKRHEGKQWDELFEFWRGNGRKSLKNASCLAVRYSILKRNFEEVWVRQGV